MRVPIIPQRNKLFKRKFFFLRYTCLQRYVYISDFYIKTVAKEFFPYIMVFIRFQ